MRRACPVSSKDVMSSYEKYKEIITGQRRGAAAMTVRAVLRSAACLYDGVTSVRNLCIDSGLPSATKVDVPVISIGNLTTGGTGKTPLVAAVVRMLQTLNRRPGIVSRGYRADSTGFNDEKRVLEHLCPGVPHVQNPDRLAAASEVIHNHLVDSIVLDDGFQHRRIARDLDIVLIDATNPFGYDFVLPRGLLRESVRGLRRADAVLITRCDQVPAAELGSIEDRICCVAPRHRDRLVRVSFLPVRLRGIDGTAQPLPRIRKVPVMVLAAIGNPASFMETCRRAGANIIRSRFFPDHHHYAQSDLIEVQAEAAAHRVESVVTTLKDIVKLRQLGSRMNHTPGVPVFALETATDFDSPEAEQSIRSMVSGVLS